MLIDEHYKALIIEPFAEIFAQHKSILVGYLYGSIIDSLNINDIDIALVTKPLVSSYEEFKFAVKMGRYLEKVLKPRIEIDARILNSMSPLFQYEVIRTGKIIYEQSEEYRVSFESTVLSNYLDFQATLAAADI